MDRNAPMQRAALDATFQALSDTTRRTLVERLSRSPHSVTDLARPIAVSLPTVLKHLATLEAGGIVKSAKTGLHCDRGIAAAQAFLRKALGSNGQRRPRTVTLDRQVPSPAAL